MRFSAFLFAMLVVAVYPSSQTSAFIFDTKPVIRPDLNKIVSSQPDTQISISLDVGQPDKSASRLAVKGLVLDLLQNPPPKDGHVKMPGTHGPNPELSAGLRQLEFVEDGQFVSLSGVQHVTGMKGTWEMVWKEGSPAGSLICGFELPETYSRNDATLPKGCVYLTFPVFGVDELSDLQVEKQRILNKASEILKEKNKEIEMISSTNNPLLKVMHYRNAAAAAEKYGLQPISRANLIPEMNDVIDLPGNLRVSRKGSLFTRNQVLLGSATLNQVNYES